MTKLFTRTSIAGPSLSGSGLLTTFTTLFDALRSFGISAVSRSTVTASATLTTTQCGILLVDATAGNVVLTLPSSGADTDGAVYNIRRIDSTLANTVTVQRGGSDTLEGASTAVSVGPGATLDIKMPEGATDWRITGRSGGTQQGAREAIGVGDSTGNNLLDNSSGQVFCRSVNGASLSCADGAYGHDRWYVLTQTGAVAVSTVADAENGTPLMMRLTQSQVSAQRMGYAQIVRSTKVKGKRGRVVTAKIGRLRCSASITLRYALLEWTGTADTGPTKDVVNSWTSTTFTAGNFFISSTYNILATGSVAVTANTLTDGTEIKATVGNSANNLVLFVWTDSTVAQNGTLDIGKPKLEEGYLATPYIEPDESAEREKCEEFCEAMTAPASGRVMLATAGWSTSTTSVVGMATFFRRRKFKVPSITYNSGAGSFSLLDGAAVTNAGAVGTTQLSQDSYQFDIGGSGLTASRPIQMFAANGAQAVYSADLGA